MELLGTAPEGVDVLMIRRNGINMLPEPTLELQADDMISVVGFAEVSLKDFRPETLKKHGMTDAIAITACFRFQT